MLGMQIALLAIGAMCFVFAIVCVVMCIQDIGRG